jgi:hypothetical protein
MMMSKLHEATGTVRPHEAEAQQAMMMGMAQLERATGPMVPHETVRTRKPQDAVEEQAPHWTRRHSAMHQSS